jgi:hypothetical protein
MTAGLAMAVIFAFVELRRTHPLLDMRLFAKPDFAVGAVGVTFFFLPNFGFFFVVMQYMQLLLGYSALTTALALAPLMVPVLFLSVATPWYLPRLGLRLTVSTGLSLIAVGLLCLHTLGMESSYIELAWPLLILSAGIGLCTAPTTSAIMGAVPDEKQGVASAVNDTTREIGAALGIAVAGSILAAEYGTKLQPHLGALPEAVREPASHSLAEALEVAKQLGAQGDQLAQLAQSAFLDAMGVSLTALAVLTATAAAFVAVWAPGRDGRQFRVIERLVSRRRDELRAAVTDHDDAGVGSPAGDRR